MKPSLFNRHALFGLLGAVAVLTGVPVAVTVPAYAVDNIEGDDAPDLTAVKAKIDAKDFPGAISDLNALVSQGVQHPDVYNLLGYSLRKTGDMKNALTYYQKALDFDPDHKGALEYMGELYVEIGDIAKAKENLARLAQICPEGCEERADLERAIAKGVVTD